MTSWHSNPENALLATWKSKNYCNPCIYFFELFILNCQLRPARSKHCPVCKSCVAKLDHHCVWSKLKPIQKLISKLLTTICVQVNNCVGYYNHRWFLLFLLMTVLYCIYGCYGSFQVLRYMKDVSGLDQLGALDKRTGRYVPLTFKMQLAVRETVFVGSITPSTISLMILTRIVSITPRG